MTQEVATRDERTPAQILVSQVRSEQFKGQVALALPPTVPPERFVRATVTALMQNPDLAKAEPDSIFLAAIKAAQDGLLPDGREAALVMYGQKAQYLPMIGGLRKIAAEHGWTIRTRVVYANDTFQHEEGIETQIRHLPVRPGQERGALFAAYAVATHRDGRREIEVMYREDVEKVRNVSRARNSGPWKDWEERMWEKTVGRRIFSKLALDPGDAERVKRVLDAAALEPGQAAQMVYGSAPREIEAPATPAASSADTHDPGPDDGDGHAGETGAEQDAGGSGVPSPAAAGGSSDDEPEPTVTPAFQVPAAAIDEAGTMVIPKGDPKGKSIDEVAGTLEGQQWLAWALKRAESYWPAPFRAALELYVQHRLPDVWAQFEAHRAEAA